MLRAFRLAAALESLDLQEGDILLRLDTRRARGLFTNPNETPDVVAQIGERLIVHSPNRSSARGPIGHPRRDYITA